MKEDNKIGFCFICCFMSFILCLITLFETSFDVLDVMDELNYLENKVEKQDEEIQLQNKTIESYKNYVDNVSRCIIDGEW